MTIGRWFAIAAGCCAISAAGCGDNDDECPSDIVVVISTPADDAVLSAADDNDPDEEGIQIAVTVRSNLSAGDSIELTVGTSQAVTGEVDEEGSVTFSNVTVPAGDIEIRATGGSIRCGTGDDAVAIFVGGDGLCQLAIDNGPI